LCIRTERKNAYKVMKDFLMAKTGLGIMNSLNLSLSLKNMVAVIAQTTN
jgi:hypothetical protein